MASARSTLLNLITRLVMRLIFRRRRPILEYRASLTRLDRPQALPSAITLEEVTGAVPGRWLRHAQPRSKQTLLYLHGGAFIMRLPQGHGAMVARFCADSGISAFMAWYRLAPEHPFPAAPEDCLAAYRMLLDAGHRPEDIVVMGDSAGGNLALAVLHLIRRAGLPMPSGVIALSPITDFAQISATWRLNHWRDPMYRVQGFVNPVEHYLQGANPVDPVASPYYGDLSGFPPLYFLLGELEALLDDSVGMVRKAIESGVPARIQIWQGMPHVFVLKDVLPEAAHARREIAAWLRGLRERAPPPAPLYRSAVEVFDLQPFTGRLRRESNEVFLSCETPPADTRGLSTSTAPRT